MPSTARDLYNLYIRANWGFSSTLSKIRGFGKHSPSLAKKQKVPGIDAGRFNDSVIAVNSTFLEVVDSGNRWRGIHSTFGLMGAGPLLFGLGVLLYILTHKSGEIPLPIIIFFWLSLFILVVLVLPVATTLVRWDMFRKTHYPIRFNRIDRKVYAWSQDMGVVTMNWDDIHFYQSKASASEERRGMGREEVRGYVKDADGNIQHHLVFFKYEGAKMMRGTLEIWELVRRYMEEPDGHIQAYRVDQRVLALEGRREGFFDSLVQATRVMADSPIFQVVFALMVAWAGTGRILAKWTCRVPRWPAGVEEACRVAPDDPYVRNRHNERPLKAGEALWPLFCFLLGWAEALTIFYFLFRGYF
ncbi:hypothetical protein HOP51_16150 [Halomonas sp. MCCC 1A11036]|uniref:DUF6708 domain-containing protein n=1 Tax=Billgrantia zhangzhouensis TaxID=2733481 RepID=A0ABS9AIM7_9GAMM|nr:DUF6708 domain-containing protein [Halomonas zhangzhouensis]MCE8021628.1 hypothetical protein [Halomonas zhangzhouensis]